MKKILLLSGLAILALSGCSHDGNDNPAYAPEKNPNPKYFMTVKGKIDPAIAKPIGLQIFSTFNTSNPQCKYDASGGLEGAMVPLQRIVVTNITTDNKGNYEVKIPVDYFQPGKCLWMINSMAYQIQLPHYTPIIFAVFTENTQLPNKFYSSIYTKIVCDKTLDCNWAHVEHFNHELLPTLNYSYQIDFDRE